MKDQTTSRPSTWKKPFVLIVFAALVLTLGILLLAQVNLDTPMADGIEIYSGDFFEIQYPKGWTPHTSQEGIITTVSFGNNSDVQVFSVVVLPNQAGDTTSSRVSNLLQTSPWTESGTTLISGNSSSIVELGESEAGPRYIFVTTPDNAMSYIFDIQTMSLEQSTIDQILTSFVVTI